MKSFAFRSAVISLVLCILAACQSTQSSTDALAQAFAQIEQNIAEDRLDNARDQLAALEPRARQDERLPQFRRQLADAYMLQGREALQRGDLNAAAKALSQARSLLPDAPALSNDVRQTLEQARQ
ncbi:conserved exported hypothetical protein [Pseudomonas sp. 8Z]|uniref:hypothetical protein n=1 Tax=Pseudomonas sp. 8Z TaxID=2653166 RepID=UPI0012F3DB29|nr:hypothetical protein [Pseudomonas sp. 8Z]VXD04841.1 conserved exported hypothetical protein [Pseudomonas sp. 8Z]